MSFEQMKLPYSYDYLKTLPSDFIEQLKKPNDAFLYNLYKYFDFMIYNFDDLLKENIQFESEKLLKTIQGIHFLVYDFQPQLQNPLKQNAVLCFENKCMIIKSIDPNFIMNKLNAMKITFINTKTFQKTILYDFKNIIKESFRFFQKNEFFKLTFDSLLIYIIKRFYYPTNYFVNNSFFKIDPNITFHEKDLIKFQFLSTQMPIIYLVLHKKTFQLFAMKMVNEENQNNEEIYFINHFSHYCLTPFYGFVKHKNRIKGIIYKFMSNGSLIEYFENNEKEITTTFKSITINRISQGIQYLHKNLLVHQDLQPSNILIDNDLNAYISDFETIREVNQTDPNSCFTNNVGSPLYISPEQSKCEKLSFKTDIFSFGLIIYYVFEKEHFVKINNLASTKPEEIVKNKIKMKNSSNSIQEICNKSIQINTEERPTIDSIQKVLSIEANGPNFLEVCLPPKLGIQDIVQFYKQYKQLSKKTKVPINRKFIWLNLLFIFFSQINMPNACLYLGYYYYYGNFFDKDKKREIGRDYPKALHYLQAAASMNNSEACLTLGNIYYNDPHIPKDIFLAIYYYKLSADLNNSEAMFQLGLIYKDDGFIEKDINKSLNYFEKAAKLKNSKAMLYLGNIYFNGEGVEKNTSKALRYYELAAINNNSDALCKLGDIYYKGNGVEKNYKRSYEFYEMASNKNNFEAYLHLGNMYLDGNGLDYDISKAMKNYQLSIKILHENNYNFAKDTKSSRVYNIALNNLGLIHITEYGFYNKEAAIYYIQQSAYNDYQFARNNLALLFEFFYKDEKIDKIIHNYEVASNSHFALAEFNLGRIYEKEKNMNMALKYYIQASDDEDKPIIYKDKEIYDERLELSKKFVIFLTNIKLIKIYLTSQNDDINNRKEAKKYFNRSISKFEENLIKIHVKFQENKLQFFALLKKYILNSLYNDLYDSNEPETKELNNNKEENKNTFIEKIKKNAYVNQSIKNDLCIDSSEDLFDVVMEDQPLFIETLKNIIKSMNSVLYMPPFPILFGRICKVKKQKKYNRNVNNYLFKCGFGLDI